ncbi:MmcQ/YjbR family DNA-binding protein [Actinoalloteichus hymeniacidonis]|uniref:Uncharacterized protein n=1 Tax=Actinoalloteichus hymeniacidonis TaxID=340345 RepID=A0AAC9MZS8_9PSEU|nr:MmcQ/YjbR family DNA-binding protein [Actinoalloteichus hymeniacidonis]AOS64680.1 hypothetical protein TL08_19445 [Actinoalloteichus hymeniacidonis]MBB5907245.1 putative DNA-binding protein (MmcQ/YjbR family) [Actinoalloteichus hymeniacidonis]
MTPQEFIDIALWFPEATEDQPYGPDALVYKVAGKSFAILAGADAAEDEETEPARITLKCEPDLALELRAQFPSITPGYHTDKRHWNTIVLDGTVPDDELVEMTVHSYQRVIAGLRRADRDRLTAVLGQDAPPLPGETT